MKDLSLTPPSQPLEAALSVPGSKSYTNRALLLAAMTPSSVRLANPLVSDDTRAMIGCLEGLGIKTISRPGSIEVVGDIRNVKDRDYDLNADLSGTTIRFVLALCAVLPGRQTLRGQAGLNKRPIGDLVDGLRQLGAKITYLEESGYPPLVIEPPALTPGTVKLPGSQSSQYLSALLMAAPLVGDTMIEVIGELNSKPFVDMTLEAMRQFGIEVTEAGGNYHVAAGQAYKCSAYVVEGDVSSASYFFAIAALTGSKLTVKNLNPKSFQADMGFLKILEEMGSDVAYGQASITVTGQGMEPVNVDMRDCPDQAQTLAVLAAFADGQTIITGIQSLRVKETERIVALQQELDKMGIKTESTDGSLTIHGGRPRPARIATYGDHRMAMSFAVAGAKLPGMVIEEPDVVTKTFPDFWEKLAGLGIGVERSVGK